LDELAVEPVELVPGPLDVGGRSLQTGRGHGLHVPRSGRLRHVAHPHAASPSGWIFREVFVRPATVPNSTPATRTCEPYSTRSRFQRFPSPGLPHPRTRRRPLD